MADLYALTEKDVATLKELVKAWRHGFLDRPINKRTPEWLQRADVIFGVADASIPGTTGTLTEANSATMNVYRMSSTGGTSDSGLDETVFNLSSVARTTAEYTVAVRDYESGNWMAVAGSGGESYKKLCRFILDAALTTTEASKAALLTNQYGEGTAHSTGAITVYNLLTSSAAYLFSGSSGGAGLAFYDSGTDWRIIQMECT